MTASEIAEMFGINRMAAYRKLTDLVRQGKARQVRKTIQTGAGHPQRVSAYVLVKP